MMADRKELIEELDGAVQGHDPEAAIKTIDRELDRGVSPDELRRALFEVLESRRRKMMTSRAPLPEFLVALDAIHAGLDRLAGHGPGRPGTPLVIGVVEGDPHDFGKNIVAKVFSAGGYDVHDLGRMVTPDMFVESVVENKPRVLALSAMMSTTMIQMPGIISKIKQKFPEIVIMVGGAPLDATLARSFGADGYAESAVTLLEETEAALERVEAGEKW
jgi:methylmalonyl-CoA mutase cobalamin-binding domain/chain